MTGVRVSPKDSNDKKIDFVGDDVIYIGEAQAGTLTTQPYWRIKKLTFVGDDITTRFADNSKAFIKIWDDRLTYTY